MNEMIMSRKKTGVYQKTDLGLQTGLQRLNILDSLKADLAVYLYFSIKLYFILDIIFSWM